MLNFNIDWNTLGSTERTVIIVLFVLIIIIISIIKLCKGKPDVFKNNNNTSGKNNMVGNGNISTNKNKNSNININNYYGLSGNNNNNTRYKFKDDLSNKLCKLKDIIELASSIYKNDFSDKNVDEIANIMQENYLYNDDVNQIIAYNSLINEIGGIINENYNSIPENVIEKIESIKKLFDFEIIYGSPDEFWSFDLAAKMMECSNRNKNKFLLLIKECLSEIKNNI